MNPMTLSVCSLVMMAGCGLAGVRCTTTTTTTTTCAPAACFTEPVVCLKPLKTECCTDQYRAPYYLNYPNLCYFDKVYPSNTAIALRMRQEALLRQREILCFEKGIRDGSPWNTDPAGAGHVVPGSTDGAGAVPNNPCSVPPPAYPYPGPSTAIRPVAERDCPVAVRVPGRAGYVFCPFGPNHGCVCVKGIRSGSIVQDPFTKQYFRVP